MNPIEGKWAGGIDGHMIYEFIIHDEFDPLKNEFRIYTTADSSKITKGNFIATDNSITFFIDNEPVGFNGYEVNGDILNHY